MRDFPVLDCAQEQNGNPYFHRSHANGRLCQERLLRSGNVRSDLSSKFLEVVFCEYCCFMRVVQRIKLRPQSARKWNACVDQSHFATYVHFYGFLYFSFLCFVSLVLIRSVYSVLLCSTAGSYNRH